MFVSFSSGVPNDGDDEWTHKVANRFSSNTSRIMPFCIAVVTAIGMFFSMIYTSWGMALFPISLFRQIRAYQFMDTESIQVELKVVRNDLDLLYTKYIGKKNALERRKKLNSTINTIHFLRENACIIHSSLYLIQDIRKKRETKYRGRLQ